MLKLEITLPKDRVLVLYVAGDASTGTILPLQDRMARIFEEYADRAVLVVDLSELTFASSTMLGTLLRFRGQAQTLGRKVVVVIPKDHLVHETFVQANLDKVLPQYDSVEEAIQAMEWSDLPPKSS